MTKWAQEEILLRPCIAFVSLFQQMRWQLTLSGNHCSEVLRSQHPRSNLDALLTVRRLNGDALQVDLEPTGFLRGAMRPRTGVRVPCPAPGLGFAPTDVTNSCHDTITLPIVRY
jgi:hypothetical protein